MNFRTHSLNTFLLLSSGAAVAGLACDLPQKDIGIESESGSSDSAGDLECTPGDEAPSDDGCNTCFCTEEGLWACTEIACDPSETGVDTQGSGDDPVCEEGDEMPADDGCNTCSCVEGQWACTLIGCVDTDGDPTDGDPSDPFSNNGTHICDDSVPFDSVAIVDAAIEGHDLELALAYSGGCEVHLFGSCWDGLFLESFPVQVNLRIAHDGMDDPCDAYPTENHTFDLSALAEAYMAGYQTDSGTIHINLEGHEGPLVYEF
jgi:hypothetical protein